MTLTVADHEPLSAVFLTYNLKYAKTLNSNKTYNFTTNLTDRDDNFALPSSIFNTLQKKLTLQK